MSGPLPNVTGGILSDINAWVRRLIKAASTQAISTEVIDDYINRFVVYDMAERIELNEFRRQYTFETVPNIFEYQAPFTSSTTNNFPFNNNPPPFQQNPTIPQPQTVVPVYQFFKPPIYCDGVLMGWFQSNEQFYNTFPEYVNNEVPILGSGGVGPFTIQVASNPILRAFIDDLGNLQPYVFITTLLPNGNLQYIVDSGYLDTNGNGILIQTDSTFQNIIGAGIGVGGAGTVNYLTGQATFTFISATIDGANINVQTSPYSAGFPRICLFYNNTFKLYPVPDKAYKIQVDAFITPTVFFQSNSSVPFAYMSEYIARGAARKILSDTGDYDQFGFYESLFREQENLVLRRTSRQNAQMRTPTIFSSQTSQNANRFTQY